MVAVLGVILLRKPGRTLGAYSPILLKSVLSLVLLIFLYSEETESNTTSDWLNHTV